MSRRVRAVEEEGKGNVEAPRCGPPEFGHSPPPSRGGAIFNGTAVGL